MHVDFRHDFRLFFPVLPVENLYLRTGVLGALLFGDSWAVFVTTSARFGVVGGENPSEVGIVSGLRRRCI